LEKFKLEKFKLAKLKFKRFKKKKSGEQKSLPGFFAQYFMHSPFLFYTRSGGF
jgi:hypothetical protein